MPSKKVVLFNTSRKILGQAPHSYCNRPSSVNLTRRGKNCLLKPRNRASIYSPPPHSHPQLRYSLLHYLHLCYPNPDLLIIHNRTNIAIVLNPITLPICDYRGPLWPTLLLQLIIIYLLSRMVSKNKRTNASYRRTCEQ